MCDVFLVPDRQKLQNSIKSVLKTILIPEALKFKVLGQFGTVVSMLKIS